MAVFLKDVEKFIKMHSGADKFQMIQRVKGLADKNGMVDSVAVLGVLGCDLYPQFFAEYEQPAMGKFYRDVSGDTRI